MDEYHKLYMKQKKPDTKENSLYDSICIKLTIKLIYSDRNHQICTEGGTFNWSLSKETLWVKKKCSVSLLGIIYIGTHVVTFIWFYTYVHYFSHIFNLIQF